MEITILLSTANRAESLRQTLASLSVVNVPRNTHCTLMVVDNASVDHTRELIRSCKMPNMSLEYVYEPRRGKCFALNTGLQNSKGEIILFLDDDVRPPQNWVTGMSKQIINGNADAVVGGVRIAPHLERSWMTPLQKSLLASTDSQSLVDPLLVGANCCVDRRVFEKIPNFDSEIGPGALGLYDDTLFSFQLKKAGFRIATAFDIVSEHHFDKDRLLRDSWLDHAKRKGRSLAYLRYHWMHKKLEFPEKKFARSYLSLVRTRLRNRNEIKNTEGISNLELTLVSHVHLYKQLMKERKRPPNYEQFGLTKLS